MGKRKEKKRRKKMERGNQRNRRKNMMLQVRCYFDELQDNMTFGV